MPGARGKTAAPIGGAKTANAIATRQTIFDLDREKETLTLKADTVIWTTGWEPYDVAKIQPCGYAHFPNVITSVKFERLADPHGPTGGKLLRPPDGKVIRAKKLEEIAVKVVK